MEDLVNELLGGNVGLEIVADQVVVTVVPNTVDDRLELTGVLWREVTLFNMLKDLL